MAKNTIQKTAAKSPPQKSPAKTESSFHKSKPQSDKIIITAALPYANGPIHIGHLLEYIQADIYSRFLKLVGKDALYICASDMHGTPIEVNAKKSGMEPKAFAEKFRQEHQQDFASFLVNFDNYYHTDSPENKELAQFFFQQLRQKSLIYRKKVQVIYCPHCARYLPDRFVRGTCPFCSTLDQYGDVCEKCGNALKGVNLINPKCSLCGRSPLQKESEHYFFKLSSFSEPLKKWFKEGTFLQAEVKNWLKTWLEKGLEDWCVSRDAPYFGFEIPDAEKETGEKKYFYVWLDAPIGYISSTKNYCDRNKQQKSTWGDYWKKGQVYHFIGKDIAYFHFLFWPAMLLAVGIPLPKLTVHGFITVNGEKMSKSRGTFFTAKDFLKLYAPESLRFYYASHLDRTLSDVDLNFEDFKEVINHVLVSNLGNFCYRVLTFAQKNYGETKTIAAEKKLVAEFSKISEEIRKNYFEMDFKSTVKNLLRLGELGNAYFQKAEPWKNKEGAETKAAVGLSVNFARNLALLLSPILPQFSRKVAQVFVGKGLAEKEPENEWRWEQISFDWKGKLNPIELLVEKIETVPQASKFPLQMVVGQIKSVKDHPNADTLYLMKVDLGPKLGERQVVAGLRKYFSIQTLLQRKAVFCANLKPAKLRGELSEAMVFAADDGEKVALLEAEKTPIGEEVFFSGLENSTQQVEFDEFKRLVLSVSQGKVEYQGKRLVSKVEEVAVRGVKDGARIY